MLDKRLVNGARLKPTVQQELFKQNVKLVSVETHSYCNRRCWFCPNSFLDRHSFRGYLPEDVYLRMLKDLGRINYEHVISFTRYMEPFADNVIYKRVAQARAAVPKALLRSNTNGDFINTSSTLDSIVKAGLDHLMIQVYPLKSEFDRNKVLLLAERKLAQLDLSCQLTRDRPDWLEWDGKYKGMRVGLRARDFRINGENRGGIEVSGKYVRTEPCYQAFHTICVHYTGEVIPCCHLRSDHPEHKHAIMGTIDTTPGSLFKIYTSKKMSKWRKMLSSDAPKKGVCKDCAVDVPLDSKLAVLHFKTLHVVNSGRYKEHKYHEGEFTDKFVRAARGKVVVDCGACWGYYSALALWAGCKELYAFEPNKKQHGVFLRRAFSTDARVKLLFSALADYTGTRQLWSSKSRPLQSWSSTRGKRDGEVLTMPCTTLDSAVTGKVDVIKCDVEGDEVAIFKGAQSILHEYRPVVFLELHWLTQDQYAGLQQLFRSYGYPAHFTRPSRHVLRYTP